MAYAKRLFRPIKVRYYLDAMRERGIAPRQVLARCDIDMRRLDDPSYLIDIDQLNTLIRNMIRLSKEPSIGLQIGANSNFGDYGIVGFAMMSAATIRQGAALWNRFSDLIGMPPFEFRETDRTCTLLIESWERPGPVERFCTEEYMMIFRNVGAVLLGRSVGIERCTVPYDPPPYAALYSKYVGAPVIFNAPYASVFLPAATASMRPRSSDPEINALCTRRCIQKMRDIAGSDRLPSKLRKYLLASTEGLPDLSEAAAQFDMSTRSLHRHLADEGTSYRTILESVRIELAKEYLKGEHLSSKEVGYLLGFKSAGAFGKAFKTWTGMTIGKFVEGS